MFRDTRQTDDNDLPTSSSSGLSAIFNKLKALALELGVHGQQCAQFRQYKNSDGADG